jgi:hypothetical protein
MSRSKLSDSRFYRRPEPIRTSRNHKQVLIAPIGRANRPFDANEVVFFGVDSKWSSWPFWKNLYVSAFDFVSRTLRPLTHGFAVGP